MVALVTEPTHRKVAPQPPKKRSRGHHGTNHTTRLLTPIRVAALICLLIRRPPPRLFLTLPLLPTASAGGGGQADSVGLVVGFHNCERDAAVIRDLVTLFSSPRPDRVKIFVYAAGAFAASRDLH